MPRLDDDTGNSFRTPRRLGQSVRHALSDYFDWVFNGNILEVAIGLIIASAFTGLITSLTSDILLPVVSLLPFLRKNFREKFAVLKSAPGARGRQYNTMKQALDDGAVVMAYGAFVDKVVNFLVIGLALYTFGRFYGWASGDKVIKRTVKCKYCRKQISEKAQRCVNCTSWQNGRDD